MNKLKIKRIYLPYDEEDGYRILIDRLWPRGISKVNAVINEHCKYIAPSTEIRKAFGHKEENFDIFKVRYLNELNTNPKSGEFIQLVSDKLKKENVILLYAANYRTELANNKDAMPFVEHCKELLIDDNVTLLYGAKSETCNHAIILKDRIMAQLK